MVLVGDFNATPESPCHAVLTGTEASTNPGFPIFKNAFAPDDPGTFHGFSGKAIREHIDWVLYRGAITPTRARVITDAFEGGYPSDHFPLLVEFSWGI